MLCQQKNEKQTAFNTLNRISFSFFNSELKQIIEGLLFYWFKIGGQHMSTELTPEKIMEYGKQWHNIVLAGLEPEKVMAKFSIEDRLKGLKPKDRLEGLKPKDRLEGLTAEEIKELDKYLKKMMKKKSI